MLANGQKELKYPKTMKAITPSEHEKNITTFSKIFQKIQDEDLLPEFGHELQQLDSLYTGYLEKIQNLRKAMKQYHDKTASLREMYKNRKSMHTTVAACRKTDRTGVRKN